jgi:uncharacterized protein YacL
VITIVAVIPVVFAIMVAIAIPIVLAIVAVIVVPVFLAIVVAILGCDLAASKRKHSSGAEQPDPTSAVKNFCSFHRVSPHTCQ